NGDLDVYERKVCYDECEKIYVEAIIFINNTLVRLIDITVEQWLDLKYDNHTMVSNEIKESVIATWLIQSYKKQFEYMEIKKQNEVYRLDADMEYDPSNTRGDDEEVITNDELSNSKNRNLIEEAEIAGIFRIETDIFNFETPLCKAYEEHKNAWIYEWKNDIPWVDNMSWWDYVPWMEPSDDVEHVCTPGDFSRVTRIEDEIYFESYEWYENLEDSELKDEALNCKGMLEESINGKEESSDDARTHHSPGNEWEDFKYPPYYVNEEKETSMERRCKLLKIPYMKPPTCKSEKFE
nr:hypothetical protein [Tanacetum cinerariifolium]